eukprot:SAG22_NODE_396_length_11127_cov_33.460011_9_plen_137_part_00
MHASLSCSWPGPCGTMAAAGSGATEWQPPSTSPSSAGGPPTFLAAAAAGASAAATADEAVQQQQQQQQQQQLLRTDHWTAADELQMKQLHEEWFPVRYPDIYWQQACRNQLSLEGWNLFTQLRVRELLSARPAAAR